MTFGWVDRHSGVGRNPGGLPLIIEMLQLSLKMAKKPKIFEIWQNSGIQEFFKNAVSSCKIPNSSIP
jgi:hypothetical protein